MDKDKLIEKLEEYIVLLETEVKNLTCVFSTHGYRGYRIEEGKKLREEIKLLKEE